MIRLPHFAAFFDPGASLPGTPDKDFKGYRLGVSEDDYRPSPGINVSILKGATPCDMLHEFTKPPKEEWTGSGAYAKTLGTFAHWIALEPWKMADLNKYTELCVTDGLATKKAMEQRAVNPGKMLVTPELLDDAMACMRAVKANPLALSILQPEGIRVATEAAGYVFDTELGVRRKWKVDVLPEFGDYMADVKTTRTDGSKQAWERECYNFGYYLQAAWYLDCHELLTGQRLKWFYWIVITTEAPFKCRVVAFRNMRSGNPLYDEKSKLRWARLSLGLEPPDNLPDSGKFQQSRLATFIQAAQETAELQAQQVDLTEEKLRLLWPAFENEDPILEII